MAGLARVRPKELDRALYVHNLAIVEKGFATATIRIEWTSENHSGEGDFRKSSRAINASGRHDFHVVRNSALVIDGQFPFEESDDVEVVPTIINSFPFAVSRLCGRPGRIRFG